jgi:Amt family ammonium transporter
VGFLTGAVGGLATITPAAGYVSPMSAAIIGIVAGVVCYGAVMFKNRMNCDDALDVWGVHGVGGMIGIIMLGIFATKTFNPVGADGLLAGNPAFRWKETAAVVGSSVWAFVFTYGMLWLIDRITPVKVGATDEAYGLDAILHGERAYLEDGI